MTLLLFYCITLVLVQVTNGILLFLQRNNLPAVRQYLETFAILIYLKFPTSFSSLQALSSYVFIAANVILHSWELAAQINHLNQLLPPILPFLTSHHHSLRCFTQVKPCNLIFCGRGAWCLFRMHILFVQSRHCLSLV